MKKIIVILFSISIQVLAAPRITLQKVWQIPAQTQYQKFAIGGLSGCSKLNDEIFFVSDDRGNQGEPRILILKWDSLKSELNTLDRKWLLVEKSKFVLDLEGIAHFSADKILMSSEGDLNQKPRQKPEIFWMNGDGKKLSSIQLSDKFIPNLTGEQTKGIQINSGFEGLSIDHDHQTWGAFLERPLVQDSTKLYFIESSVSSTAVDKEWSYSLPQFMTEGLQTAAGVSEFLYDKNQNLLVLERGVSLSLLGMKFNVHMCTAQKVPGTESLKKDCFYDFSQDKTLMSQIKSVGNFEGLCWLNEQKTQFMVVSDNNFSKNQNTLFLLYQID